MAPSAPTNPLKTSFDNCVVPDTTDSQRFSAFALSLYLNGPEPAELASALTDGPDDKKIDFCHIDRDAGLAVLGQCYLSASWDRSAAPANKAAELATGINWLLEDPLDTVPARIRTHAEELREAISDGSITRITVAFVHNCPESDNVDSELRSVARSANRLLNGHTVVVSPIELGASKLLNLLNTLNRDILVAEQVMLQIGECSKSTGPRWEAAVTEIHASELHDLHNKHGDSLFSRNIRGYLGVLRKSGNVNQNIKATLESEPESFWVYNNGITILTNRFEIGKGQITLHGLSVINGAQTTGVIGECNREQLESTRIACRFIQADDESVVEKIIRYNNTQNAVKAFDLESADSVQRRLRSEFESYKITYIHRRTSELRRSPAGSLHAETVAQAACAFHGDLQTAIRSRSSIFEEDSKYSKVFPPSGSAEHYYLIQCLSDAIDSVKSDLRGKINAGSATEEQEARNRFLSFSTTKQFLIHVVGQISPQLMGRRVPDLFAWKVKSTQVKADRSDMVDVWVTVLERILPRIVRLCENDLGSAVRSTERAREIARDIKDHLEGWSDEYVGCLTPLRETTNC